MWAWGDWCPVSLHRQTAEPFVEECHPGAESSMWQMGPLLSTQDLRAERDVKAVSWGGFGSGQG